MSGMTGSVQLIFELDFYLLSLQGHDCGPKGNRSANSIGTIRESCPWFGGSTR